MKNLKDKMRKKPGPKPKPAHKKAQGRNYSYNAEIVRFLDGLDEPGKFVNVQIMKEKNSKSL